MPSSHPAFVVEWERRLHLEHLEAGALALVQFPTTSENLLYSKVSGEHRQLKRMDLNLRQATGAVWAQGTLAGDLSRRIM